LRWRVREHEGSPDMEPGCVDRQGGRSLEGRPDRGDSEFSVHQHPESLPTVKPKSVDHNAHHVREDHWTVEYTSQSGDGSARSLL